MLNNKESLKEEINKEMKPNPFLLDDYEKGRYQGLNTALNIIDKLEELDKPVIPEFIANYYESLEYHEKLEFEDVNWMLKNCYSEHRKENVEDVLKWIIDNPRKYLEMVIFTEKGLGYEIEKEKLYYVLDKQNKTMLYEGITGDIENSRGEHVKSVLMNDRYKLTEKQIKNRDARFMDFAVPVEKINK